jgi:hypothetical protein
MTAHLTGWRLSAGDDCTVFDGANRKLVTVPCGGLSGRTAGEAGDCAQLMAAAPDLLAALRTLLDEAKERGGSLSNGEKMGCAAIAKAKGGAQ